MSKIFKPEQCIEALPCRLEPISEAAFFNNQAHEANIVADDINLEVAATADVIEPEVNLAGKNIIQLAKAEAKQILESARSEANQMLAEASSQVDDIKNIAYQEGLVQGKQEGLLQIKKELSNNLVTALSLLSEAELERERRILTSEPELLKVAFKIAEKIIGMELQSNNAQIQLEITKQALSKIAGASKIKIKIHPDSLKSLTEQNLADLQSVFAEPKPLQFEADPNIEVGGCYIESEHGNVDARLQTQLDKILTELLRVGQLQ